MEGDLRPGQRASWLPTLAAGGVAAVSSAIAWGFTCDDAAITFRFAEQAAAGHPLGTVAPGDPIVSGFSNPTWTAILATASRAGLPVTGTAKVLGALCFVLIAVLATRLIGRLVARPSLAWAGCAVGASCTVATWAVSGLENALVGLLVTAAALLLVSEEQDARLGWRGLGSSLVVAALVVSRPDAFAYLGAAGLARMLATRRRIGPDRMAVTLDLARWALAPVAVLAGWTLFAVQRFGHPLANTVYAKVHLTLGERLAQFTDVRTGPIDATVTFAIATGTVLLVPLAVVGCWRRGTATTTVSIFTAAALVLPLSEADWMADYRFYAVLVPLVPVLASVGLDALLTRWAEAPDREAVPRSSRLLTPARFGAALFVLWALVNVSATAQRASQDFEGQVTVADVRGATLPLSEAGDRWGVGDPLVMTADAGAAIDDLDLRIVDLAGLIDPQIGHLMDDARNAERLEYAFAERRPDLVRAGTSAWSWNQRWGLTPDTMEELGYVAIPNPDPSYIRRDLVVRPAVTAVPASSRTGLRLDELLVPAAAGTDGLVTARAWIAGHPDGDGSTVRLTLARTGAGHGRAVLTSSTPGSDLLEPDQWDVDEAVLHVGRLTPPAGDGPLWLSVEAVDGEGAVTELGRQQIATGPAAVAAGIEDLAGSPATGDPAHDVAVLQAFHDLAAASPSAAGAVDDAADGFRSAALDQLRTDLDGALADGADPDDLEPARRAIGPLRGRAEADGSWTALARGFQQLAAGAEDEQRYRLLVIAATADPSSASIQRDLLAARAARPSRQLGTTAP